MAGLDDLISNSINGGTQAPAAPTAPVAPGASPAAGTPIEQESLDNPQTPLDNMIGQSINGGPTPAPLDFPQPGPNEPGMGGLTNPGDPYQFVNGMLQNKPLADKFLQTVTGGKPLGPPGLTDNLLRTDLGFASSFDEMQKIFKRYYPQGDMMQVPIPPDSGTSEAGGTVTLFRKDPKSPWARVDEPGLQLRDLEDQSKAITQGVVGVGAGALSGGAGFLGQLMAQFAAGAGTDAAISAVNRARGVTSEDLGTTAKRATVDGFLNMVGYGATAPFLAASRPFMGLGAADVSPEGVAAIQAAKRQGFVQPYPFQAVENPVLQRIGKQAMANSTYLGQRVAAMHRRVVDLIGRKASPAARNQGLDALQQYSDEAKAALEKSITDLKAYADPRLAGSTLQQSLDDWDTAVTTQLGDLYSNARSYGNITFDLSPVKQAVAVLRAQQSAGKITNMPPEIESLLKQIEQAPTILTDQYRPTGLYSVQVGAPEILDAWRRHAFQAKNTLPGQFRVGEEEGMAQNLFNVISGVFDHPVQLMEVTPPRGTMNAIPVTRQGQGMLSYQMTPPHPLSGEFGEAWTKARTAARERFETLDQINKLTTATDRAFAPVAFANKLLDGSSDDTVRLLYRTLYNGGLGARWKTVQDAAKARLLDVMNTPKLGVEGASGADAAENMLNRFSPEARIYLLGGEDNVKAMQRIFAQKRAIEHLGIEDVLAQEHTQASAVMRLVTNKDTNAINQLLKLPENDPTRQAIRYGLLDQLYALRKPMSTATGALKDVETIPASAVDKFLKDLRSSGADRFLTKDDIQMVEDTARYMRFIGSSTDVGTSIQAAEAASNVAHVTDISKVMAGLSTIIRAVGFGRVVTSPWMRVFLMGVRPGESNKVLTNTLRATGDIFAQTAVGLQRERQRGLRGVKDITDPVEARIREGLQAGVKDVEEGTAGAKDFINTEINRTPQQ